MGEDGLFDGFRLEDPDEPQPGMGTPGFGYAASTDPTTRYGEPDRSRTAGSDWLDDTGRAARARAGRRVGRWALGAVVVGTLAGSVLLFQSFNSIDILSGHPLGHALLWLTGWMTANVVIALGLVTAVVALVRRGGRRLGLAAMATALLIAPLVFLGAAQLGVNQVQQRLASDLSGAAGEAGLTTVEYARQHGVDLGPFEPIIDRLLGDG